MRETDIDTTNGLYEMIANAKSPNTPRTRGQIASQKKAAAKLRSSGRHRASAALGHVQAGEVFSVKAFIERMGTTRSGLSEMRRRGLKARRDGGRVMILADDYLEYLASQPVAALNEG